MCGCEGDPWAVHSLLQPHSRIDVVGLMIIVPCLRSQLFRKSFFLAARAFFCLVLCVMCYVVYIVYIGGKNTVVKSKRYGIVHCNSVHHTTVQESAINSQ